MNSIGNDIVDLNLTEPPLHARYLERVFSKSELEFIDSDHSRLWLVWSAKEAAYKCIKRIRPEIIFSHKKFIYNYKQKKIVFENIKLECEHSINNNYVYSYCMLGETGAPLNWIESISGKVESAPSSSLLVRELAINKISNQLRINSNRVSITNSKFNIPEVYIDDTKSPHLLSFSHHGNFIAACSILVT